MLKEKIRQFFDSGSEFQDDLVLINILTRTSGRPNGFKKCRLSIENQTHQNVRHIVSYDTKEDLHYLKEYNIEKIRVKKKVLTKIPGLKRKTAGFKPYNLYCNKLLGKVRKGWILFLDDDDMLMHNRVLEELVEAIQSVDPETLLVWKTRYPDGRLLPNEEIFRKKTIEYKNIDTACFTFHASYRKIGRWDAYIGADFRFLTKIAQVIPKQKWLPVALTQKNNFGDHGGRNDISE